MKSRELIKILDELVPNPHCELNYNKDYELLIATVLSAQSTDKTVNLVTPVLFSKYDIYSLKDASIENIERIIKPVGTYHKKALYIKKIAQSLVDNYDGKVPNNREYLENLKGVGHKTCNVVLAELFNEPTMAIDTHMIRVSNRLGLTNSEDVKVIEEDLKKYFPIDKWNRVNHQLLLFGRYRCKSIKPECDNCPFNNECKKTFKD